VAPAAGLTAIAYPPSEAPRRNRLFGTAAHSRHAHPRFDPAGAPISLLLRRPLREPTKVRSSLSSSTTSSPPVAYACPLPPVMVRPEAPSPSSSSPGASLSVFRKESSVDPAGVVTDFDLSSASYNRGSRTCGTFLAAALFSASFAQPSQAPAISSITVRSAGDMVPASLLHSSAYFL
jgi:hypothetical protein